MIRASDYFLHFCTLDVHTLMTGFVTAIIIYQCNVQFPCKITCNVVKYT